MAKAKIAEEEKVVKAAEEPEVEKTEELTDEEKKAKEEAYLRELVPFYAFKDGDKYKDDIICGVNGVLYQIQRGKEVMIPRFVYNVIVQGMEQDAQTAEIVESYESSFNAEAKSHNL